MESSVLQESSSLLNDRVRYSILDRIGNIPVRDAWARELQSVVSVLDARKLQPLRSFLEKNMQGIASAAQVGTLVSDVVIGTLVGVIGTRKVLSEIKDTRFKIAGMKKYPLIWEKHEDKLLNNLASEKRKIAKFSGIGAGIALLRPVSLLSYGAVRVHLGERVAKIMNRIALTPEEKIQKEQV